MKQNLSPDEKIHRELYQAAHHLIAVYNPTLIDYKLIWDRHLYTIPNKNKDIGKGNGIEYLSAFLAKKYTKEMTNKILQERAMGLVNEENERRRKAGMALLTKYDGENSQELIEKQIGIDDGKFREDIGKELVKGLVQKAPEDLYLAEVAENDDKGTSVDDKIFNSLSENMYEPANSYASNTQNMPVENIQAQKDQFVNNLQNSNEAQESSI